MANYLVISAIGEDRAGTVERLSATVTAHRCNIEDSRMSVLGGSFALIQLVSGQWNNLAKLENALAALQGPLNLTITSRNTEQRKSEDRLMPYTLDVVTLDHPGIVNQVAAFLATRGINIQDMVTSTYHAAHTATPMLTIRMTVEVPSSLHIAQLREEFMDLCDEMNLDGVLEPIKVP